MAQYTYQLIRLRDDKLMFDAAYTKYYPDTPYCALFEEYPAVETQIQICKKAPEDADMSNKNYCKLVTPAGVTVGIYTPITTARTEKDANSKVEANILSEVALFNLVNEIP